MNLLTACGNDKSDSGNNGGKVAAAPAAMDNNCIAGANPCNNNIYNNYQNYGFMPYPNYSNPYYYSYYGAYGYYGNNGFCECPAGYRPVYSAYNGLGCVKNDNFNAYSNYAVYWWLQPNNSQWVNIPQVTNLQPTTTQGYNCYQNVAQTCFVNTANSCGYNATCLPSAPGSVIGVCTLNNTVNTTGNTGYR